MTLGVRSQRARGGQEVRVFCIDRIRELLQIPLPRSAGFLESIPFALGDTTAGSETELQAAVSGPKESVDLPIVIEGSNYFANIIKRSAAGDTSSQVLTDLQEYLENNTEGLWENSWVRFRLSQLNDFAKQVLDSDMVLDKKNPQGCLRDDSAKFLYREQGEAYLRVPISYLLKLSLADVIGSQKGVPEPIRETEIRLMDHFLNDNTSPETFSFCVVPLRLESGFGRAIAKETSKRYLLSQLLIMYANEKFGLKETGQNALLYLSPHPPIRQKKLNDCISDSFYRELFMSPCLSGWDNGLDKHGYMCLCHQVLSRSQLNGVAKLKEAGIITRNLVVLPNVSNISLANNGTHLSLGSTKLTKALRDQSSGFTRTYEKFLGDLVTKVVEHFLPLFVGTYSAAPYRLGFADFHPEKVLGFLPHELDYTHLRMIWRRWKKKAKLTILGRPITPFGIDALDRLLSMLFRVKGDFVPDFRLLDYLVAVMSSDRSPGLDGKLGNAERLKKDLADLGVFDEKMALYLPYRLREFSMVGFSGFEGRHYSLFESLEHDMARAADLQTLVTALAFKLVLQGKVTHSHIPDDPFTESERRQIFFGSAIGLPTFFVHSSTGNLFMKSIMELTRGIRYSRRYSGYMRVYNRQYKSALVRFLVREGSDLIEMLNMKETLDDLSGRLERPDEFSAAGRLTRAVLSDCGTKSPLSMTADDFNAASERHYRTTMKKRHLVEGLNFLIEDLRLLDSGEVGRSLNCENAITFAIKDGGACEFVEATSEDLLHETASVDTLTRLINLTLLTIYYDRTESMKTLGTANAYENHTAPIRGEGNG